jgi:integrase
MMLILAAIAEWIEGCELAGKANARRLRALVLLLRYSGLRIGDAVSCSVDRLANGKLRLYTQKTGTHVYCPLPEFVVRELEAIPKMSDAIGSGQGTARSRQPQRIGRGVYSISSSV